MILDDVRGYEDGHREIIIRERPDGSIVKIVARINIIGRWINYPNYMYRGRDEET